MGIIKPKWYSTKAIREKKAQYNIVIGVRSNGKSYCLLMDGVREYWKTGKQFAYLRRWQDEIKGKFAQQIFQAINTNGEIKKLTKGEWEMVLYRSGQFFFASYDDATDTYRTSPTPCGFAMALTDSEHLKSTAYPNVTLIIFDEFLSRKSYLPDEFNTFAQVLSTIIRERDDVTIFMLGNTVSWSAPYFAQMGLTNVRNMREGDIDVYQYGESGLRVAVEYSSNISANGKKSDVYFAFDNPHLKMITKGAWEMEIYPHCPMRYEEKDVLYKYYIMFEGDTFQANIIAKDNVCFTYIHRKTTPIRKPDEELIFSTEYDVRPNWRRRITKPTTPLEHKIAEFYKRDMVYYQDNVTGECIRNYLKWCNQ